MKWWMKEPPVWLPMLAGFVLSATWWTIFDQAWWMLALLPLLPLAWAVDEWRLRRIASSASTTPGGPDA